jgi:hypothetical protein
VGNSSRALPVNTSPKNTYSTVKLLRIAAGISGDRPTIRPSETHQIRARNCAVDLDLRSISAAPFRSWLQLILGLPGVRNRVECSTPLDASD